MGERSVLHHAFNLLIKQGVLALISPFISRVSAQSSVIAPLSIAEALRRDPQVRRVEVSYSQDDTTSAAETLIFQKVLTARGFRRWPAAEVIRQLRQLGYHGQIVPQQQRRSGFDGLNLDQARAALMEELLAGHHDTPLGPIHFHKDGELVQGRFDVFEVRMNPDGCSGRFQLLP